MEEPTPPGDYECCESACEPCVWDTYYAELAEWKALQAEAKKNADAMNQIKSSTES